MEWFGSNYKMNLEDKFNIKLIENYIRTYYKDPLIKKKFNEFFCDNNNFNKKNKKKKRKKFIEE